MRGPSLRRLLSRIAVIGVPALSLSTLPATTGCPYCGEDTGEVEHDVVLDPDASGTLATLISRCEADAEDCVPLCEHVVTEMDEYFADILECTLTSTAGEQLLHVRYYDGSVCGRRPAGLPRCHPRHADPTAAWLAHAAHLEAASVPAFERLADDLADHAAPAPLVAAARAAARDEIRHAASLGALAVARGALPASVTLPRHRPRSLAALAVENAVEGCVRETFGAIVTRRQAAIAGDREVRTAMRRIAADEARHATLAHAIDAWASPRLTPRQRRTIEQARRSAAAALRTAVTARFPRRARVALGLPAPADAARMLDAAAAALRWT